MTTSERKVEDCGCSGGRVVGDDDVIGERTPIPATCPPHVCVCCGISSLCHQTSHATWMREHMHHMPVTGNIMSSSSNADLSDVLFVRHFPRGFGEDEMRGFFSQFGRVISVRVVKSRKTGQPKNVAYVRFQVPDVAKIAADAMDNYLMFGKLMRCGTVSADRTYLRKLFPRENRMTTIDRHKISTNKQKSEKSENKSRHRKLAMLKKSADHLSQFGLTFVPVVIGVPSDSKQVESVPSKKKEVAKKGVPVRPLLKKKVEPESSPAVTTTEKRKKSSGLKIRTITPSASTGKRKRSARI